MNETVIYGTKLKGIPKSGRFAKNWAYLLTSSVFSQTLGMVAMIRVARELAPAGYGYYNLVQTTAGIGLVLAGFGMRNVIIRDCSRNPEKARTLYSTGLLVRSLFGFIVALGIMIYTRLSPDALPILLSGFTIVLLFGQIVWDTTESISFGLQRMEFSSWINTLGSVVWVLWVWCAPASILTITAVSLSFVLLQLVKAGTFSWQIRRIIPSTYILGKGSLPKNARHLVIDSLPFYWLALMTMAQNQFPVLILAERSKLEQVGLFNVGFRLLIPLQLLIMTGLSVLYPYLSKAKFRNTAEYMQAIEKALKMTVVFGSCGAFLLSLFRKEVVAILFGAKYAGSSDAMAYQCWYTVLYAILCIIGISLAASDKQRWLAALTTAYTLVALPIIWFGAAYGATGLAAGMIIGASINLTYHWYFFQKSLPSKFQTKGVIRFLIILISAALCSWLIPTNDFMPLKVIIAFIILSGMMIIILKNWKQVGKPQ